MSNDKRDLTRIEDLGEFIHELEKMDDLAAGEDWPSETPDLPTFPEENEGSDEGTRVFNVSDLVEETFESQDEKTTTFQNPFTDDEETPPEITEENNELPDAFNSEEFQGDFNTEDSEEVSDFETSDDFLASINTTEDTDDFADLPEESTPILDTQTIQMDKYKAPETFEDLKKFSEDSSFTGLAQEGNPSFSVMIKDVRFVEDVNDIVSLLREMNLLGDSEETNKNRLMRGTLLIPRISEYSAVFLTHKLRRFDIDLQMGLSDEIHPPKHQESPEIGVISKYSLYQNHAHNFHFDDPKLELNQIIVSATATLEGYQVVRYQGVASEHKMLDSKIVEDESSSEIPAHYQELAQKLRAHALKNNSNAIVGLNYQLTPIPFEYGVNGYKYRLTCTGNLVWVNKL